MLNEGLSNIFTRHAKIAQMARTGIKSLGLPLFAEDNCASNSVTAVKTDDKLDAAKLIQILRDEYNVVIAPGQRKLRGKIFRIGHLGLVEENDIKTVLEALARALPKAKF